MYGKLDIIYKDMGRIFNKRFFAISAVLLVLVVLVFFLISSGSKKKTSVPPAPTPAPSSAPDNNTIPISDPRDKKPLVIVGATASDRPIGLLEGFVITFSQTPSTSEFFFEISPSNRVSMTLKDKSVYIAPQPEWKPNTQYKILIKSGTKDVYGNLLERNFELNFKTVDIRGM